MGTATGKQRAAIPHPGRPRYYRALFDQLADPVFLLDTETLRFVDANEAASRCYGYSHDEFLRMTVLDLHPQDEQERVRERVKSQMTGRSVELRHVTKDGRQLTVEITSAEVEHEGHACRLSIVHDISARRIEPAARPATKEAKQAQDDLALQKAYLEQLIEAAPEAIVVLDTSRRVSRVNREFTHMFGYTAEETVGRDIDELIVPEGKRSEAEHVTESVSQGSMVSLETLRRRKDGSTVEVSILGTPVSVGGGQVAFYAIYRDITDQKRAEKALTESESIFRAMADTSASAIYIHDRKQLLYVNAATEALTGYSAQELLGRDPWAIVAPEYRHLRETARVRHPGEPVPPSYDCKITTKAGEQRWLEFSSSWIRFKGEKAILVTAFDVTDRKRSEALQSALYRIAEKASSAEDLDGLYAAIHQILGELMYAKNCYIAVYDAANDMVTFPYFVDEKDKFTPPRKFARGLTEYVLRTGQPLLATPEALNDLVARGEVHRIGAPSLDWMGVPLKQGDETFGALVLQSYEDKIRYGEKEKEILIFVSQQIATAIEHKRNQDAIRESEAKFRALAESATPAIYIYDENRFHYVNPATERLLGYSAQELLAMENIFDRLLHPDFRHAGKERAAARLRGGTSPARDEFKVITKNGEERWVDFSATTIQFGGKPANVATAVDITERKRGEALQSALYRIADKTSSAEDLPEFYASIHKIVGELMYARNFYIALHDEGSQTISFVYFQDEVDTFETAPVPFGKGLTEYVLRTGQSLLASPGVYEQLISSGEVQVVGVPAVDWLGVPLKKGDKAFGVLAVQSYHENIRYNERDKELLTFVSQHVASAIEHKRNEEALRQSEARYRSLVQSAVYGIYRSTVDDRFVDVNPALVAMLGYSSAQELRRLRISRDVYADWEEHERLQNECRTKGRLEDMEVKWKRKDASLIAVRLSGRAVTNAQGQMQGLEMIAEDITERRALEDQLRQAQKMEAVGRLAGGVAHDFNNLLTVIKGYSELMLKELKPSDPLHSEVEEVQKAADRAASLTRQLLAFSRQQVMAPKVLDLNQVVGNMDKLLRRLLGEDVDLFAVLDPHIGRVKADPGQLEQVIMNLAVNARDAMPKGGKLTIETANVSLDANYAREHVSVKPGSYVMMAVTDNGIGMDAETCARVFEPFFTTKEQGKGTGLGLSTVYGIVKQSGGYIWVYSEVGRGTSFKVYLPRVDEAPESVGSRESSAAAQRGTETVLLVEDEDGVRALIRQVLHKHGYTVIQARHGGEALLLCERHPGQIHLLLTDVVLAQMSGDELADRLAAIRPEMKVLFMSGYTDEAIVQHGVLRPGTAFLQKPFTTDSLLRIVREVLDVPKSN